MLSEIIKNILYIDHIVLTVSDIARTKEFYAKIFGEPVFADEESIQYTIWRTKLFFWLPYGTLPKNDKFDSNRIGLDHFAIGISSLEDLQQVAVTLDQASIEHSWIHIDTHSNKEKIRLKDPDGIKVEFFLPQLDSNRKVMIDDILSYKELCDEENVQTLQRGMNFRLNPNYSVILMSRRSNAPYKDRILEDGITIEYEWHDEPNTKDNGDPKKTDQPRFTKNWTLTQNGKFMHAVDNYKKWNWDAEIVKVYEKILPWVWSLKGMFNLVDYKIEFDGNRNVYVFVLQLSEDQNADSSSDIDLKHTRLIPSEVKKIVWQRDWWKCVLCWSEENLHFDHDLPFSKWGTSLTEKNIKLLCMKCNLSKSDRIE